MECWDRKHCIVKIPYGTRNFLHFHNRRFCENGKLIKHLVCLLVCWDIHGPYQFAFVRLCACWTGKCRPTCVASSETSALLRRRLHTSYRSCQWLPIELPNRKCSSNRLVSLNGIAILSWSVIAMLCCKKVLWITSWRTVRWVNFSQNTTINMAKWWYL